MINLKYLQGMAQQISSQPLGIYSGKLLFSPEQASTFAVFHSAVSELISEIEILQKNDKRAADEIASYRTMSYDWQQAVIKAEKLQHKINKLAEEFRRLAAETARRSEAPNNAFWMVEEAVGKAWEQAAQMVEERLN